MSNEREVRVFSAQIRALSVNGKRTLSGRAAGFGRFSHDLGGFREIIKSDAFDNALRRGDETILTMNHDQNLIMARTRNGSLRLAVSPNGLDFSGDLPNTQAASDLFKLVKSGIISECSFAFKCDRDEWPSARDVEAMFSGLRAPTDLPIRVLRDVTLFDVSAVSTPAYPSGTSVTTNMDPAATRPHFEGASVPQSVLLEARKHSGPAIGVDAEHQHFRDFANRTGKLIAADNEAEGRIDWTDFWREHFSKRG